MAQKRRTNKKEIKLEIYEPRQIEPYDFEVGMLYGIPIVRDDEIKEEIKLPKAIIRLLQNSDCFLPIFQYGNSRFKPKNSFCDCGNELIKDEEKRMGVCEFCR